MNVNGSFQTANGSTVYYGAGAAAGPRRAGAWGGVAVDRGSDGTIDRAHMASGHVGPFGAGATRAGFGPNGSYAAHAHAGPNGIIAGGTVSNGEARKTWGRLLG